MSAGSHYVCLAEIASGRGMSDVYSKAQHHVGWAGGIIACSRDEDTPRYRGSGELYPASALWWGRTLGCKATETSMGWRDAPRLNNLDVGGRSDTSPSGRFRTTRVPSPLIQTSISTSDSLVTFSRNSSVQSGNTITVSPSELGGLCMRHNCSEASIVPITSMMVWSSVSNGT